MLRQNALPREHLFSSFVGWLDEEMIANGNLSKKNYYYSTALNKAFDQFFEQVFHLAFILVVLIVRTL